MTTRGLYAHAASGLSPACSGSDVDAQRDPHRLKAGKWPERAGRGNDCRNRCGGLEQAGGPRRYSRGLVAARSVIRNLSVCFVGSRRAASGARSASDYSANLTRKVKAPAASPSLSRRSMADGTALSGGKMSRCASPAKLTAPSGYADYVSPDRLRSEEARQSGRTGRGRPRP